MKKILVVLPVDDSQKRLLEEQMEAEFLYCAPDAVTEEQIRNVNVIIGNISPEIVKKAENLELLQLNTAGTEGFTAPGVLRKGARLTNASGAYGLAISEHLLGMLLTLQKKLHVYRDQQKEHVWRDRGPVQSIWNSTTLVVGLGDIGGEFAGKMKALGSYVIGIRRTAGEKPDCADEIDTAENLDRYLGRADIVALCVPGSPSTYHLMNAERFAALKKGAILLNVGRGGAIDPDALFAALRDGTLAGCGIDVTDPEPLPETSPLWDCENLLITPHVSGGFHLRETFERIVRIAARNLRALKNGETLVNEVDFATGYRKRNE